ncbi:hypothetical protein [Archaeoglobus sp.]
MDDECQKLLAEKDAVIRELQEKINELERKLRSYEIRDVYKGIIPDEVLEEFMKLTPEQMVIEIGKYLREKAGIMETAVKERNEKISKMKGELLEVTETVKEAESGAEKTIEAISGVATAKVGVDLNFTQKYDYEDSDVAFLGEDLMKIIGAKEGDYVTVRKNGSVNLKVISYSKDGFIVVPTWVREKISAKVNDMVEVSKR